MRPPTRSCRRALTAALLLVLLPAARAAADQVLFDFEGDFDPAKVTTRDATVAAAKSDAGAALRAATGHAQAWPGFDLVAPAGHWNLAKYEYIALDVKNVGAGGVQVCCRVDNTGADGVNNCNTDSIALKPGQAGTLKVVFRRKPPGASQIKLFGMRGYPVPQSAQGTIDPAQVTQLVVFVPQPGADHAFEIDNVRAGGSYTPPPEASLKPESFFPLIDVFGQYVHKDWPGKVHSLDDLAAARKAEDADLQARPGPENWDRYGGWKDGPALKATGFFRAEKYEGKWWLVDPEGRLFFSHGIDCVGENGATPIEQRENWFADLPEKDPDFKAFFSTAYALHGHYKGRRPRCFDFAGANALRKYGPDWRSAAADLAHRRLRSWGLNTIANWSDSRIYLMKRTPYVVSVWFESKLIEGSEGYWGKFKDPFDPQFEKNVRAAMGREAGKTAGDPWCIGYFVDNEISWGDETSLALAALKSPPDQAAKKAFVADLETRYGDVAKLNAAWGTDHASWDALLAHRGEPDRKKARPDLLAFYTRTAEQYFTVCRDAVKAVAPDNLYLGCRFAWVNELAAKAGAKFCDVVSYNLYRRGVADFRMPADIDRPVIIGEFHFGALDRGMFHTGLVPVATQQERAAAYKGYVQGAIDNPLIVGCHWFKYQDEPTTGRPYDEENYQIGFIDIVGTPYPETIAAGRDVGYALYGPTAGTSGK